MSAIDLEILKELVSLGLEDELKGGSIRVTVRGQEGSGIFGNVCPKNIAAVERIARAVQSAIDLDWSASGRKEPRSYGFTIRDAQNNIRTERVFAFAPEEVTTKDLQDQALATSLLAIQGAQQTIREPYELIKAQLEGALTARRLDQGEIDSLRTRVRELEKDRQAAEDKLAEYRRANEGAELVRAQAEAVRIEATAKAKAYSDMGQAAIQNAPILLSVAAKLFGVGSSGGARTLPPGATEIAARMIGATPPPPPPPPPGAPLAGARSYTPPPGALSEEALSKVHELARALSGEEVARLIKFAWDADPDGAVLLRLFLPERGELVMSALRLVARDWRLT